MQENNSRCRIEVLSLTDAIKKQNILAKRAIPSEIIKIEASNSKKGCTYGLEFACGQTDNVRSLLDESGAKRKRWIEE